ELVVTLEQPIRRLVLTVEDEAGRVPESALLGLDADGFQLQLESRKPWHVPLWVPDRELKVTCRVFGWGEGMRTIPAGSSPPVGAAAGTDGWLIVVRRPR